jgi:hypothetical protein
MNWTSTQHSTWADECGALASKREPFRLDHVATPVEKEFCDQLCSDSKYLQEKHGSSVTFTPASD